MDATRPRLDRLFNAHSIAEQILGHITLLHGFVTRFANLDELPLCRIPS
jgi:hypothetical protein